MNHSLQHTRPSAAMRRASEAVVFATMILLALTCITCGAFAIYRAVHMGLIGVLDLVYGSFFGLVVLVLVLATFNTCRGAE